MYPLRATEEVDRKAARNYSEAKRGNSKLAKRQFPNR